MKNMFESCGTQIADRKRYNLNVVIGDDDIESEDEECTDLQFIFKSYNIIYQIKKVTFFSNNTDKCMKLYHFLNNYWAVF